MQQEKCTPTKDDSSDEEIPVLKELDPKMQQQFNIHKNFKFISAIGKGCTSIVNLYQEIQSKKYYAVKETLIPAVSMYVLIRPEGKVKRILQNILQMIKCDFPNIIKCHGYFLDGDLISESKLYSFHDYVKSQSLKDLITKAKDAHSKIPDSFIEKVLLTLSKIAFYLDFHLDLVNIQFKPEKIFVDEAYNVYLLDFKINNITFVQGAQNYLAPETADFDKTKIDQKSDVFNLGMIILELCALESFNEVDLTKLNRDEATMKAFLQKINQKIPGSIKDILFQMLTFQQKKRPTCGEISLYFENEEKTEKIKGLLKVCKTLKSQKEFTEKKLDNLKQRFNSLQKNYQALREKTSVDKMQEEYNEFEQEQFKQLIQQNEEESNEKSEEQKELENLVEKIQDDDNKYENFIGKQFGSYIFEENQKTIESQLPEPQKEMKVEEHHVFFQESDKSTQTLPLLSHDSNNDEFQILLKTTAKEVSAPLTLDEVLNPDDLSKLQPVSFLDYMATTYKQQIKLNSANKNLQQQLKQKIELATKLQKLIEFKCQKFEFTPEQYKKLLQNCTIKDKALMEFYKKKKVESWYQYASARYFFAVEELKDFNQQNQKSQ